MNTGVILALLSVAFNLAVAIGYATVKDIRHSVYFLLAAAITVNVIWK